MTASGPAVRRAAAEPYEWTIEGDAGLAAGGPLLGAAAWVAARAGGESRGGDAAGPEFGAAPAVVRLAPLLDGVLADVEAGAAPGFIGARLQRTVALSGGVFQNRLLVEQTESLLEAGGFEVLSAGLVPVTDGEVSLGQAAVAGYTVLERRGPFTPTPQERPGPEPTRCASPPPSRTARSCSPASASRPPRRRCSRRAPPGSPT